jgi:hypothetical protein
VSTILSSTFSLVCKSLFSSWCYHILCRVRLHPGHGQQSGISGISLCGGASRRVGDFRIVLSVAEDAQECRTSNSPEAKILASFIDACDQTSVTFTVFVNVIWCYRHDRAFPFQTPVTSCDTRTHCFDTPRTHAMHSLLTARRVQCCVALHLFHGSAWFCRRRA